MIEEAKKRLSAFVKIHVGQIKNISWSRGLDQSHLDQKDYNIRIKAIESEIEKELLLAKEEGRQEGLTKMHEKWIGVVASLLDITEEEIKKRLKSLNNKPNT